MGKRLADLVGKTFGRWTVIEFAGRGKRGEVEYKCRCACGTEKVLRRSSLTSGNSKTSTTLAIARVVDVLREKQQGLERLRTGQAILVYTEFGQV